MKLVLYSRFLFILLFYILIGCQTNPQSAAQSVSESTNRYAILTKKLGGSLDYDPEIENYIRRIVLRINTLNTFRDDQISIEIVNQTGLFCLFFEDGKLMLSQGLLSSLSNESELISAIALAMLSKASIENLNLSELKKLPDFLSFEDYPKIRKLFQTSPFNLDIKKCHEITYSLGYHPSGLLTLLKKPAPLFLGIYDLSGINSEHLLPVDELSSGYLGESSYEKVMFSLKKIQEKMHSELD